MAARGRKLVARFAPCTSTRYSTERALTSGVRVGGLRRVAGMQMRCQAAAAVQPPVMQKHSFRRWHYTACDVLDTTAGLSLVHLSDTAGTW